MVGIRVFRYILYETCRKGKYRVQVDGVEEQSNIVNKKLSLIGVIVGLPAA